MYTLWIITVYSSIKINDELNVTSCKVNFQVNLKIVTALCLVWLSC